MVKQILNKLVAIIIILLLTMGNLLLVATNSYAVFEELEEQKSIIAGKDVSFDTYFYVDEKNTHSVTLNTQDEATINFEINVGEGYLKSSTIELKDANFDITSIEYQSVAEIVKEVETSKITLNQISSNTKVIVSAKIKINHGKKVDENYLGRQTNIVFTSNYTDIKGKTQEVNSNIAIRIDWTSEANSVIDANVEKYMILGNKTIIQTKVISAIENNVLPIKNTNIKAISPQINGLYANDVRVTVQGTIATNGVENGDVFQKEDYTYNNETGILEINTQNLPDSQNKISWQSGADEYIITYIYEGIQNITNIDLKVTNNITTYRQTQVEGEISKTQQVILSGNNVDFEIMQTEKLNKGYMYANSEYETEYKTTWSANISYAQEVQTLVFDQQTDKFVQENGKKQDVNSYYKQTKINKANFNKILSEEGQVRIYNGETLVGIINKDTQIDDNQNYVLDYNVQISNIKIETTKPVSEGKLLIENIKAITAQSPYKVENIKDFRQLEGSLIASSQNQETQNITVSTILEETTTKSNVQISKQNLSTIVTNQNVEIRAVLEADDISDDLYKNPTIEIALPEEVEAINIKSGNLLFSDTMEITKLEIVNSHIIKIQLTGEQTTYVTDGNKGITIILNTDLSLNRLVASKKSQITMKVTNQKAINMENEGISSAQVNIVAPVGVIALNSVTNTKTGEIATSLESQKGEGNLQRNVESQIVTYTQTIINNNQTAISKAKIIGTIPSSLDKYNSNVDTKFASAITSNEGLNIEVYYSENIDATCDLENDQNGWTKEQNQNSKAYLIQINDDIQIASKINFTYNVQIPENLEYGVNAVSSYKIEYEEGSSISGQVATTNAKTALAYKIAQADEKKEVLSEEATPVALTTGSGPVLEINMQDDSVDGTIYTEHVAKYKLTITNKGTETANNVKLNISVPEGLVYARSNDDPFNVEGDYFLEEETKLVNLDLGNIEVNKTIDKEILLYAKEKDKSVKLQVNATADNMEEGAKSNQLDVRTKEKIVKMKLNTKSEDLVLNEIHGYTLDVSSNDSIKDLEVKIHLPEGIEYETATIYDNKTDENKEDLIKYSEKDRNITFKLDELTNNSVIANISIRPTKIVTGQKIYATAKVKENSQTSNVVLANVKETKLEVSSISSVPTGSYVKVGESIDYEINIKNTSELKIDDVNPKITLPIEVNVGKVLINDVEIKKNEDYFYSAEDKTITILKSLQINENAKIKIQCYIDSDLELEQDKEISININVEKFNYSKIYNYTIEKNIQEDNKNPDDGDNDKDPENPAAKKYKISGIAWLDVDKNGQMSNNETKISAIPVKAINKKGEVISTTTTKEDGTYTLENLLEGEYTVVFEYDSNKYLLTTYQAEGVEESLNSNVIKGEFEGKTIATTNNIKITNRSIANINIGLIEGSNFDLSLNKKVTQISMVNSKRTLELDYDTQLAKIDLDYQYINNTKLAIEYEITITNEGDIPGYATKIVDYLPTEFDFSAELNKDWYTVGKNIETKLLADSIINPGQSVSVKLVLTKNMTENDNGIVCNTAEIAETYNEFGQKDSDSTPANNKDGEDDISSANVILGIRTGGPVTYITLTLTIMTLICIGAYEINKRVLKI